MESGHTAVGSIVLWLPSHHPGGCRTLLVVEGRPHDMIVEGFGCLININQIVVSKMYIFIFPIDMGFDLVRAKFGGITRDDC